MTASFRTLYLDAYRGINREIWLLSVIMFINRCGAMMLPFLTLYAVHRGFSIEQGGILVAVYGSGAIVGGLIGGKLTDYMGFYKVQYLSLISGGLLLFLFGQMVTYTSMLICAFILSMVYESFRPANYSAIAHYSHPQNRTKSFSLIRLAINLGFGIVTGLGGLLAYYDYHYLFWTDGGTSICAGIAVLLLLPKVTLEQQKQPTEKITSDEISLSPYQDKKFLFFLVFVVLFACCFFQLFTNIPLFFKQDLLLNERQIGIVMAVNGIIIALLEIFLVNQLEGKRSYISYITIGTLFMAASFSILLLPVPGGFLLAVVAMIVLTMAEMTSMPFMNSYYINLSNTKNRGQYSGLYSMSWSTAQVLGSSVGAWFSGKFGFQYLLLAVVGICLISAGGFHSLRNMK